MDISKLISFALFFPGFLFSLSVHESAHALVANRFGDPTAKRLGRITLNPLPHMDIIGTFFLPIFGFFWGGFLIGWGVPVPVNYRNLKNWKKDGFFIAGAGPLSNLLLAIILAGLIHLLVFFYPDWLRPELSYKGFTVLGALVQIFYLNLALAFFNLIPVHPLDGGKILYGILPQPLADRFDAFVGRYGIIILLLLFFTGAFRVIIWYPISTVAGWLL